MLFEQYSPAYNALTDWPHRLGVAPRGVVVISAHWQTVTPMLAASPEPETLHDFFGFPSRCYDLFYICQGDPELAAQVAAVLAPVGGDGAQGHAVPPPIDIQRGLDHGAWLPLMLAFPVGEVPVVELSVQPGQSLAHHLALGRALAPLRDQGVLILGSGGAVHNLDHWAYQSTEVKDWAWRFEDALAAAVAAGDEQALLSLPFTADGRDAHPTLEHYLPLLVAFGAAGVGAKGLDLHRGFHDGSLSMAAFAFGEIS